MDPGVWLPAVTPVASRSVVIMLLCDSLLGNNLISLMLTSTFLCSPVPPLCGETAYLPVLPWIFLPLSSSRVSDLEAGQLLGIHCFPGLSCCINKPGRLVTVCVRVHISLPLLAVSIDRSTDGPSPGSWLSSGASAASHHPKTCMLG